tara:strand:- start:554 stop:868 length:315 start_codon:yes stop_codon:yes gene_type:complete
MSKFGDLISGASTAAPEPVVPPTIEEPVYEAPGTPASVEPDIAPPVTVDDLPDVPSTPVPTWSDLNQKSKYELEQIGRTIGIELDRRLSHNKLVDQLLDAFANQ